MCDIKTLFFFKGHRCLYSHSIPVLDAPVGVDVDAEIGE